MAAHRLSACHRAQILVICYSGGDSGPWGRPKEDAILATKSFRGRSDEPLLLPWSRG